MDKTATTPSPEQPKEIPNPVGRPTKYNPSMIQEVDKYLEFTKNNRKLPTIEGFGIWLGVDHESIVSWSTKRLKDEKGNKTKILARPEFFVALKRIRSYQKDKLVNDGLYGGKDVNATMAIFLLKVNHEMIETQYIDHSTKGKELPTPLLGGATNVSTDNSTK